MIGFRWLRAQDYGGLEIMTKRESGRGHRGGLGHRARHRARAEPPGVARRACATATPAGLAEVAKLVQGEHGGQARVVDAGRLRIRAQAARAIDGIVREWGRLDVLVNAAGIISSGQTSRGPVLGIAEADWDRILDVNLLGTVYCAQAAART